METRGQNISMRQFFRAFFPVQLLISHIKYNLLALFYWFILFLIITDRLGYSYGIPLLFYSPEYLGEVSGFSFFFIGFAIGGFTMGFNTYSYIRVGKHFPFLLAVRKPFLKFCLNNSIIPIIFSILYIIKFSSFQIFEEFASKMDVFTYIIAYIAGFSTFMFLSMLYFFPRKNSILNTVNNTESEESFSDKKLSLINKQEKWSGFFNQAREKNYIYVGKNCKLYNSRSITHFDEKLKEKIFISNRVNTSVFELSTIIFYISVGLFREYTLFEIPAAMSIVLLLTVILMLFSAMLSWLQSWTYPIFFIVIFSMDYLSTNSNLFTFKNSAYGLCYENESKNNYSIKQIEKSANNNNIEKTILEYTKILDEWKAKTGEEKPKLIISNSSGGGSRSALWSFTVLQKADELLNGQLAKHLHLMTGASGGMIGAAYFREILLRFQKGELKNMYSGEYREKIARDLLNKLCFSAASNDLFFRYQKVKINGYTYKKDRGYSFEQQLHKNTENMLNHSLGYYKTYESKAVIPVMLFSPTIVNDGRRLNISSQSLNFISASYRDNTTITQAYENIDYQSFFKSNNPNDIRFSTVLRAQATFPFVLPMVTMPTSPGVQLMDAGIRDNYGGKSMMEFLYVMKDWIDKNTSGLVILQIRDTKKILNNEIYEKISMLDKITLPFGNMYKNFTKTQDFDQEELLKVGQTAFIVPVTTVTFNLRENKQDRISLSWHLTKHEKQKIEIAFKSAQNQLSFRKLEALLK